MNLVMRGVDDELAIAFDTTYTHPAILQET